MEALNNFGAKLAQGKIKAERHQAQRQHETAVARHNKKVAEGKATGEYKYQSSGQKFAKTVDNLFGKAHVRTGRTTRGVLEILGGKTANWEQHQLLDGDTYVDSTGSTEFVPGIRAHDIPGITGIVEAEIAKQKAALAAVGKLTATAEKNIDDQRSEMLRGMAKNYLTNLQESTDPVAKRKLELTKHELLEHARDSTKAFGVIQPTFADPDSPTPAELAALTPAERAAHDFSEFLKVADDVFTEERLMQIRKKYRRRVTGPLAFLASMVVDSVNVLKGSTPVSQQH